MYSVIFYNNNLANLLFKQVLLNQKPVLNHFKKKFNLFNSFNIEKCNFKSIFLSFYLFFYTILIFSMILRLIPLDFIILIRGGSCLLNF